MARNLRLGEAAVNAEADGLAARFAGARLRIYDGPQPSDADAAVNGGARLLAEAELGSPAFRPAVGGILRMAERIKTVAVLSGTASWFRVVAADGVSLMDGSVGTDEADLIVTVDEILAGSPLTIERFEHQVMRR